MSCYILTTNDLNSLSDILSRELAQALLIVMPIANTTNIRPRFTIVFFILVIAMGWY